MPNRVEPWTVVLEVDDKLVKLLDFEERKDALINWPVHDDWKWEIIRIDAGPFRLNRRWIWLPSHRKSPRACIGFRLSGPTSTSCDPERRGP